jgi:hypothetical protein
MLGFVSFNSLLNQSRYAAEVRTATLLSAAAARMV